MSLKAASSAILGQLAEVVGQLSPAEYARPVAVLSGNTVGKHVRHILEFYELLVSSARSGQLNYDRRQRDLTLEADPDEAIRRIQIIDRCIGQLNLHRSLLLEAHLPTHPGTARSDAGGLARLPTSMTRELHYNIEHTVHHLALIQVAMRAEFPWVVLPAHFGVAYSTVNARTNNVVVPE